jgi:chemotaxis protein methyltransferase CheR
MRPPLNDEEFRLFGEWLAEEYGLQFYPGKRDILRARLEPRRVELGFDTFEQLYFHLKFHPEREQERQQLLPHLTNNESYFFRERPQLEVLRESVLPELRERLRQSGNREIRILSAACAAGEEAYTLAIVAQQTGLFAAAWRVRVTGIDVDPRALERAACGQYTGHAFRGVTEEVRDRYFRRVDDKWTIDPQIQDVVTFQRANLVSRSWVRDLAPQHVVFCRNVLIYFDDEGITRAAAALYDVLAPGGYLFLGHAETLSRVPNRFTTVRRPGAVFYQRPAGETS